MQFHNQQFQSAMHWLGVSIATLICTNSKATQQSSQKCYIFLCVICSFSSTHFLLFVLLYYFMDDFSINRFSDDVSVNRCWPLELFSDSSTQFLNAILSITLSTYSTNTNTLKANIIQCNDISMCNWIHIHTHYVNNTLFTSVCRQIRIILYLLKTIA